MNKNTLETFSLTISGGVLSLLLYENAKTNNGQDGFLLGTVELIETKKLTDADHWVIHKESIIRITSIVPCPEQFHFYDSAGKINEEKIQNFLGYTTVDVVGWYVYRPTRNNMKLLLRERIIHKQLAQFFHLPVQHFSCGILVASSSHNNSTHSLTQTFVRYNNGSYDGIPLRIMNLSDDKSTYKNGIKGSDIVNGIIKNIGTSKNSKGHLLAKNIQDTLQKKVKDLVVKVAERERVLFQLENEVNNLKSVIKTKKEVVIDVKLIENGLLQKHLPSSQIQDKGIVIKIEDDF